MPDDPRSALQEIRAVEQAADPGPREVVGIGYEDIWSQSKDGYVAEAIGPENARFIVTARTAMGLTYRRHWSKLGPYDHMDILSDGLCPQYHPEPFTDEHGPGWRDRDVPATLAHVGFEIVAMILAEPLRRAFWAHVNEHRCWLQRCPEYRRLADLLPDGDEPILLAGP